MNPVFLARSKQAIPSQTRRRKKTNAGTQNIQMDRLCIKDGLTMESPSIRTFWKFKCDSRSFPSLGGKESFCFYEGLLTLQEFQILKKSSSKKALV